MPLSRRLLHKRLLSTAAVLASAPIARIAFAQTGKIILGQSCPLTGAAGLSP